MTRSRQPQLSKHSTCAKVTGEPNNSYGQTWRTGPLILLLAKEKHPLPPSGHSQCRVSRLSSLLPYPKSSIYFLNYLRHSNLLFDGTSIESVSQRGRGFLSAIRLMCKLSQGNKASPDLAMSTDLNRIEAPVTLKAYVMCAVASFGGIFLGYDAGHINGVLASRSFIAAIENESVVRIRSSYTSLIVSILSAGTFLGALIAGDLADYFGRRMTIIAGCFIYIGGVIVQMFAASGLAAIVVGRLFAGFGVGFVSAIIILYSQCFCV